MLFLAPPHMQLTNLHATIHELKLNAFDETSHRFPMPVYDHGAVLYGVWEFVNCMYFLSLIGVGRLRRP